MIQVNVNNDAVSVHCYQRPDREVKVQWFDNEEPWVLLQTIRHTRDDRRNIIKSEFVSIHLSVDEAESLGLSRPVTESETE